MLSSCLDLERGQPIPKDRTLLITDALESDGGFLLSHFASLSLLSGQSVVYVLAHDRSNHHMHALKKVGVDEERLKRLHFVDAWECWRAMSGQGTRARILEDVLQRLRSTDTEEVCVAIDSITALQCILEGSSKGSDFVRALVHGLDSSGKSCSLIVRMHRDTGDDQVMRSLEYHAAYVLDVVGLKTGTSNDVHGQILVSSSVGTRTPRHEQEWCDGLGFVTRIRFRIEERTIAFFQALV